MGNDGLPIGGLSHRTGCKIETIRHYERVTLQRHAGFRLSAVETGCLAQHPVFAQNKLRLRSALFQPAVRSASPAASIVR
jgi:hypothetical protein